MRTLTRPAALLAVLTTAPAILLAEPAAAADTTTTFSVAAGALSISAPTTADLGSGSPGSAVTASLGSVTVTDTRAALAASWSATVASTAFAHQGGGGAPEVANGAVTYWSGTGTTTGLGVFLPGQALAAGAVTLDATRTAYSHTVGSGNNSASWNPTVSVTLPGSAVAGTYSGTITHSVL